jgi:signal transduction histidine kinase
MEPLTARFIAMRWNMATKFSAAVVGVITLAVLSSALALLSMWQIGGLLEDTLADETSIINAEEMEVSLLEQKGLVSSYVLSGGDRRWLDRLQTWKQSFQKGLADVRRTLHTAEEERILAEVEEIYRQLDAKRDEVISLYDRGEVEEAKTALVEVVDYRLYGQAYDLCEKFIDANQQRGDLAAAAAQRRIRAVMWTVGISVVLTIGLGILLLGLFLRGVVLPLRKMIAEARAFAGPGRAEAAGLPADELGAVGIYMRTLMSDVADTRSTLERSRSRLLSAEKLASVGKLAASVAHEIRNPLTSVKMWLFSLRKAVGGDPELDRRFDIIAEEITRLEKILRNFLDFSRPPALKPRPQCLSPLIDKTLELFGPRIEGREIRLLRAEAADLPPVMADAEQLRQVWLNLLSNAAEATGEGGEIRISTATAAEADGRPMVVLRIENTGPAMPDDVRRRIFEPFFSTKEQGTGLGLCIAAHIMARHQGRLVLEHSTGQGTSFAVWIPVAGTEHDEQGPGTGS